VIHRVVLADWITVVREELDLLKAQMTGSAATDSRRL